MILLLLLSGSYNILIKCAELIIESENGNETKRPMTRDTLEAPDKVSQGRNAPQETYIIWRNSKNDSKKMSKRCNNIKSNFNFTPQIPFNFYSQHLLLL